MKSALLFVVLMLPIATLAQTGQKIPAEQRKMQHHERIEDPYMPNIHGNKKVGPGYRFKGSVERTMLNTLVTTTQVNVDSLGQNIFDDAANEPSIAVNPLDSNVIAIGWRQFDNIFSNFRQAGWAYTTNGGQSWTFPGVIEPGVFRSDPVLDFDMNGNFYYNSLTNTPDYFCKVFKSTNGGVIWDSGTDAQGGDKQWMAIDRSSGVGNGNIYAAWNSDFSTCPPDMFTRSSDGNNSYENCTSVNGDPWWGTLAVGNGGELYIGSGSSNADSLLVVKSLNAQVPGSVITWDSVLVFMDGYLNGWISVNPAGLLGQVNVDVDISGGPSNGNVYVLASLSRISNFDPGDVMFSRSTDGGQTWSPAIQINDDISTFNSQWFGTMSVAPNGRIDAVWLDTREELQYGFDYSALYYSFSVDQGLTWSPNEKISPNFDPHIGYPNQDKMGDYFDMISDNTGAHLAWANTLNFEQDVYYSYIVPTIPIGLNESYPIPNVQIFPNPNNGIFTATCSMAKGQIEITSVQGDVVYSSKSTEIKTEIDISEFSAGLYFLRVISPEGNSVVKKVVKK